MKDYESLKTALRNLPTIDEWESGEHDVWMLGDPFDTFVCAAECAQDAEYIAAANPATIRALLANLEELEQEASKYRALREGQGWPAVFASSDDPEPLRGADLDSALQGAQAPQAGGWQSIETAPKDGTLVLLSCVGWPHSIIRHEPWPIKVGGWWKTRWDIFGASWEPTHWQPLPPAPQATKGVEA